jgi:GR25 family glycosyltransferase involved in LPS biosynthesis
MAMAMVMIQAPGVVVVEDDLLFSPDFLEYFELIEFDKWFEFGNEYLNFLNTNDLEKKDYSQQKYKKGLKVAADIFNLTMETRRNRQNNNKNEFKISATI